MARDAAKLEAAKAAGAAVLIDNSEIDDLRGAILETGKVDVIYDAVGGELGATAARTLAPEGRHDVGRDQQNWNPEYGCPGSTSTPIPPLTLQRVRD